MLEDIILSDSIRYEAHTLIADMPSAEPIRIKGAFGAALLCALIVDTEEGNRRAIAIDSDEDKQAWIKRYEREVRRDEWGLLATEVPLLRNTFVQFSDSPSTLYDFCPNIRLVDLALQLMVYYMRHLVVDTFGAHIWETVPWKAPFAAWLLEASRVETRRQRLLHINWIKEDDVAAIADAEDRLEPPTLVFESEAANDIMARYYEWMWTTYQAQAGEYPGTKIGQRDKNYLIQQETEWTYLLPEMADFDDDAHELWLQWMTDWQDYLAHQLHDDYTTKSAATQFSRAWNLLGRYTPVVKDELNHLAARGITTLTH